MSRMVETDLCQFLSGVPGCQGGAHKRCQGRSDSRDHNRDLPAFSRIMVGCLG